ncbi:MAG: hypothetical protein PHC88_15725 [Terrimicrobiaceae bacterium]|nr:hypothetical protein [Terrimicrobiaceae bacterium]
MKAKYIIGFLSLSLSSVILSFWLAITLFESVSGTVLVKDVGNALFPILIGYVIGVISSTCCIFLAYNVSGEKIADRARRVGITLTWINALNAFPMGLIAAFVMQNRVWKQT